MLSPSRRNSQRQQGHSPWQWRGAFQRVLSQLLSAPSPVTGQRAFCHSAQRTESRRLSAFTGGGDKQEAKLSWLLRWACYARRLVLLGGIVAGGASSTLCAQEQDPTFTHYFHLESAYNPAAVGRRDQLVISTAFQKHATGYDQAGSTMYAAADMAFRTGALRHGVGASFLNDAFGLLSFKRFSVQYAHHLPLWQGFLSFGGQVDMVNMEIDGTKADLESTSDPSFPTTKVNGSRIDASAGVFFQRGGLYAGLSAQHLTAPLITIGETYQYEVKPLYFFTAGYNIRTRHPFLKVVPSTFLQYDGTAFRATVTGRLLYEKEKKRFYGGVSYSPQHSVTGFVGGTFHGIELGYSYEAFTSGLGLAAGQHEVTLRYYMNLDFSKRGKNKHKSVRWL